MNKYVILVGLKYVSKSKKRKTTPLSMFTISLSHSKIGILKGIRLIIIINND